MIAFVCQCGKPLSFPEHDAGRSFQCSQCGAPLRVPFPLDREEERPVPIPVAQAAPVSLTYSPTESEVMPPPWLRLFWPANLFVMLSVLALHLLDNLASQGFIILRLSTILFMLPALAQYPNVVEEIGREDEDDLPRIMRNVEFGDDLFRPARRMLILLFFCYWPVLLLEPWFFVNHPVVRSVLQGRLEADSNIVRLAAAIAALGAGTYIFPALLLTVSTSGHIFNLRPDRVWGVIRIGGRRYIHTAILGGIALVLYMAAYFGLEIGELSDWLGPRALLIRIPLLAIAVYFAHLWACRTGLLYRRHQAEFPWVFQKHEPTQREIPAQSPPV